jgi:hypothetical protein
LPEFYTWLKYVLAKNIEGCFFLKKLHLSQSSFMNAAHETQPDWGCVGLGTPGERGEKGPGGACMWLVPTRAPEIAHENLPHFIARNNTRHNK